MKNSKKTVLFVILCLCIGLFFTIVSATAQEQKVFPDKKIAGSQVVRISYMSGINPAEVAVKTGTTVIWLNDSMAAMEIQFTSKQVTMACQNPIHFTVDEEGIFISNRIPIGAVASLCFIEKGEYSYMARRASASTRAAPKDVEFKGRIIVE
jgi:plastocyanin